MENKSHNQSVFPQHLPTNRNAAIGKLRLTAASAFCVAALAIVMPSSAAHAQEAAPQSAEQAEPFDAVTAWSEFDMLLRGAYAYFDRDDIDVEAQLERSKAVAEQAQSTEEFRLIVHQTALTFMDSHLIAGPFTSEDYSIVMSSADLDVAFMDGRAVVLDVRSASPAFDADIRSGDVLVSIDGAPSMDAAHLPFGPVLPDPTAAQLDYGVTLAASGKRGAERSLQVKRGDGPVRTVELVSTLSYSRSLNDRPPATVDFVGEQGDIAVIRVQNSLGNNDTIAAFDEAMQQAAGARAIILDLRDTPSGGNTEVARSIIGHFVTEARPYQMHSIPALERAFTVPRQFVEYVLPRDPYFAGPVFVLHGRWSGSMGEGIVIGMDAATDAVTVGSNMGDLLGGLWNRELPTSGVRVDLGGESLFHVDGTPREDFVPQHPVTPIDTAPDGTDPGIAVALRILEGAN